MRAGDLIGNYRIERDLGAGSFATVWLARDEVLEAPVAIKVLADNWSRNPDIRRRFLDEARIMRRIDHDRVVRVFAVEQLATGQPMFVMAYADRGTLAERVAALAGGRSLDAVVATMTELATCLAVVHSMGIVHRDLKPTNVLFRSRRAHEGGAGDLMQLGDFGLAKDLVAASGLTLAAGTPAYMAPEQARTGSIVDQRADVYAATAILFELLVGRPPSDAETLSGVGRGGVRPGEALARARADVPDRVAAVLDAGLQPDPAARLADVHALLAALSDAVGGPPASVPVLPDAPGLTAAVASLVRRAAGPDAAIAALAGRLDAPLQVAVLDGAPALPSHPDVVEAVGDGPVDLVLTAPGVAASAWRDAVGGGRAGPVAVASAEVDDVIERVVARRAHVVASAVLTDVAGAVSASGDPAVADRWARCVDDLDRLRYDVPELAELDALRELVAGRALVPTVLRAEAEQVLLDRTVAGDVAARLAAWREYQGSGRVGFAARRAVDTVVRALERRWAADAG